MAQTEYIILRNDGGGNVDDLWSIIGTVLARSPKAAITARIGGPAQTSEYSGDGEYVAVPARSWKPMPVKVEHRTEVKVG